MSSKWIIYGLLAIALVIVMNLIGPFKGTVNSDFPADAIGQRAYVRIGHSPEPLGIQIYRVIRDIFLERFMI